MKRKRISISLLLFTSLSLLGIYFLGSKGFLNEIDLRMFIIPDSMDYRSVGECLFTTKDTWAFEIRPFFYPLLLKVFNFKSWDIFFFQLTLWSMSGVLLFWLSFKFPLKKKLNHKINTNLIFSSFSVILFFSYLTTLLSTLHAMTEVLTVFSLLVYFTLKINYPQRKFSVILIMSFLTVTKPLFIYILIYELIRISYWLYKNFKIIRFWYLKIFFSLIPVFIQLILFYKKFGIFSISNIQNKTLRQYLFARAIFEDSSNQKMLLSDFNYLNFVTEHFYPLIKSYLFSHPTKMFSAFLNSILEGINSFSYPLSFGKVQHSLIQYSNLWLVSFFIIFIIMIFIYLFSKIKNPNFKKVDFILLELNFVACYILFSSGISFWQSDRLIMLAIPIMILSIIYILKQIANGIFLKNRSTT
ncbi:MAG: hypothetical protein SFU98_05750 [Leptospiraceae bacterium]|nr:hypothetical protein [Leptospiraceae bacterium]